MKQEESTIHLIAEGMPQQMGMGPNPMQGMQSMQSNQTPPPGQNQGPGPYPPSQGMQQMMPQGMQGMDGQMGAPNPQMQQQQQFMSACGTASHRCPARRFLTLRLQRRCQ